MPGRGPTWLGGEALGPVGADQNRGPVIPREDLMAGGRGQRDTEGQALEHPKGQELGVTPWVWESHPAG